MTYFCISCTSHWSEVWEERNKCLVYLKLSSLYEEGEEGRTDWEMPNTCLLPPLPCHLPSPVTRPPSPVPQILNSKVYICVRPVHCLSGWAPCCAPWRTQVKSYSDRERLPGGPWSSRERVGLGNGSPSVNGPHWTWFFSFMEPEGCFREPKFPFSLENRGVSEDSFVQFVWEV